MNQPKVKFSQEFMDEFDGSYQELSDIKQYIQKNIMGNNIPDMSSIIYDIDGFSSIIEFTLN